MKIEQIDIELVKPNPDNPRTITKANFEKLKKSIEDFPQMLELRPIVVDKNMVALGGNMRLKALKALNRKTVHIVRAENLTPEQTKEFIAKDNIGYGEWDWSALQENWDVGKLEEWGMDIPEFKTPDSVQEDSFEMPSHLQTDIKPGDLIEIGPHRLFCGSSTQDASWKKLMAGELADLVVTDPPYNVDYQGKAGKIMNDNQDDEQFYNFLLDFHNALFKHTKAGGA